MLPKKIPVNDSGVKHIFKEELEMSMNFSVNLFGDDLEDYVKYEKLAVGLFIAK